MAPGMLARFGKMCTRRAVACDPLCVWSVRSVCGVTFLLSWVDLEAKHRLVREALKGSILPQSVPHPPEQVHARRAQLRVACTHGGCP
jgi:hypothetical protein